MDRVRRPRASAALVLTVIAAVAASLGGGPAYAQPPRQAASVAEQYLVESINAARGVAGLPAVAIDPELGAAAHLHAIAMARANDLSHRIRGERDLAERGAAAGAHFSRITENVAVGPSILQLHEALMRSEHHRENILDGEVNAVGVAVLRANGSLWAVEDFSRSVEQVSVDEQERRVAERLRASGLEAAPSQDARETCGMVNGYAGPRPAFVMRYTTGNLDRLPEQLRSRAGAGGVAAVGACGRTGAGGGFSTFSIAVLLYRTGAE